MRLSIILLSYLLQSYLPRHHNGEFKGTKGEFPVRILRGVTRNQGSLQWEVIGLTHVQNCQEDLLQAFRANLSKPCKAETLI